MLVAGQVIDRLHRARIVAVCMAAQTLVAALLVWGSASHAVSREMLFVVSVAVGSVRAFQLPTQQALTPMVRAARAPAARAWHSARPARRARSSPGRRSAAFVYAAGAGHRLRDLRAFSSSSPACWSSASATSTRGTAEEGDLARDPARRRALRAAHRPVVLGAISLDLFAVLLGGAVALLPIFARDMLHVGAVGPGPAARRAGCRRAASSRSLLTRWPVTRRAGRVLLGAVAVYGARHAGVRRSRPRSLLSLAALVVTGAADMVSVVIRQSLVQLDTPDDMRGRVSAVNSVFIGASNQLGEFEVGRHRCLARPGRLGRPRRRRHAARRRRLGARSSRPWRSATG